LQPRVNKNNFTFLLFFSFPELIVPRKDQKKKTTQNWFNRREKQEERESERNYKHKQQNKSEASNYQAKS